MLKSRTNLSIISLLMLLFACTRVTLPEPISDLTASNAPGGVTFQDIAAGDGAGIDYRRAPSPRSAILDAIKARSTLDEDGDGVLDDPFTFQDLPAVPLKARGAPGVAVFDFDGDLDIYVTNGPGTPNSLFSSQLMETGQLTFMDVAVAAGVDATDQDSSGVCFGDINNSGYHDLLVLGTGEPNRLFLNQGDGTFIDITEPSGLAGGNMHSSGCSMGDVSGNGLLDIAIANSFTDWSDQVPIFLEPFARNEPNQLFINAGNNVFVDASGSSGIQHQAGLGDPSRATITWAIAMVDYDLDGHIDIITADDQAAMESPKRGLIHIFKNDGKGNFTDVTAQANLADRQGAWMGLAFGDINGDGYMDIFVTNVGDYLNSPVLPEPQLGFAASWFLGQPDGSFTDPGVGELVTTPFGWGTSMTDYDNDGDTDIIFHGGLDVGLFVDMSNPGVILRNDGAGNFTYDAAALANSTNHDRRNVHGMAVGDLNRSGFVDIVSVSNADAPEPIPLAPFPFAFGSPFDATAFFVPMFAPTDTPGEFTWSGIVMPDGTLSVEINSGDNGNKWVEVNVLGTIGLTSKGRVNRDGIGAVVTFTPKDGQTVMQPILGGSSYASQDSLAANFGLGSADRGTVEVLWTGGVRNRLYDVQHAEQIQ
jgi:enediyne biosynthesis protein E4